MPPSPSPAPSQQRPSVLFVCWMTSPTLGSEPGTTWAVLRHLLQVADVDVVVRDYEDSDEIEKWAAEHPEYGLRVHRVPFTPVLRRIQRTPLWRFYKVSSFVLYRRWLHPVRRLAERLIAERQAEGRPIDVVWHCGLTAYWLGTTLDGLGVPLVYGPMHGAVKTPVRLLPLLGARGIVEDLFDRMAVGTTARMPFVRRSVRRADVLLAGNEETAEVLRRMTGRQARVISAVAAVPPLPPPDGDEVRGNHVLALAGWENRKGPQLPIHALEYARPDVRLRMVGAGPLGDDLRELAAKLGVADRVEFVPFPAERSAVVREVRTCGLAVYTGLREEGGLALTDGLLAGAPTAVLDNGGAGYIARGSTHPESVALIEPGSVEQTARRLAAVMDSPPPAAPGPALDPSIPGRALIEVLDEVTGGRVSSGPPPRPEL